MAEVAATKMPSKGQVVIPEEIRSRLGFKAGTKFVACAVAGNANCIVSGDKHLLDVSGF